MEKFILLTIIFLTSCTENHCRMKVFLKNGEVVTADYIQTYVSGVSNIKKCDGTDYQINTSDVKKVIE